MPGARSELSLEPIPLATEPPTSPPPTRPEPPSRPAAAPRTGRGAASREQQAKAATVVKAAGSARSDGAAAILTRPSVLIGIVAAFSDFFFDPRWTQAIVFAMLILTLVFRPAGLLGQVVREKV